MNSQPEGAPLRARAAPMRCETVIAPAVAGSPYRAPGASRLDRKRTIMRNRREGPGPPRIFQISAINNLRHGLTGGASVKVLAHQPWTPFGLGKASRGRVVEVLAISAQNSFFALRRRIPVMLECFAQAEHCHANSNTLMGFIESDLLQTKDRTDKRRNPVRSEQTVPSFMGRVIEALYRTKQPSHRSRGLHHLQIRRYR